MQEGILHFGRTSSVSPLPFGVREHEPEFSQDPAETREPRPGQAHEPLEIVIFRITDRTRQHGLLPGQFGFQHVDLEQAVRGKLTCVRRLHTL